MAPSLHIRAAVTLACVFGGSACAEDAPDPFVPQYETDRLRIGLTFDAELCRGQRDMWEDHVEILEQTFAVSREFAWLLLYQDDDLGQLSEDCGHRIGYEVLGCWWQGVVRTTRDVVPHELVHAWLSTVQTHGLPALVEGVAVRMSGIVPYLEVKDFTVDDLLFVGKSEDTDFPGSMYPRAGHFVAWLMATHGADAFMELYKRTRAGMSAAEVTPVFLDVFGVEPEALLEAYRTSAKDYYPAMGADACGRWPLAGWQDGAATWPVEGSCAGGPFLGTETSVQWQRVTIEVTSAGTYRLETWGRFAALMHCLTEPADEAELPELHPDGVAGDWLVDTASEVFLLAYPDWDEPFELAPGTYGVWVDRSQDQVTDDQPLALRKL